MSLDLATRSPHQCDQRSEDRGCHYTTLIYRFASSSPPMHIYMDFEHLGLNHASWKESSDQKRPITIHAERKPIVKRKKRKQQKIRRDDLIRYFRTHLERDDRFILDRSMGISRRPQDALYIGFYPHQSLQRSTQERAFFHRKYLVSK